MALNIMFTNIREYITVSTQYYYEDLLGAAAAELKDSASLGAVFSAPILVSLAFISVARNYLCLAET